MESATYAMQQLAAAEIALDEAITAAAATTRRVDELGARVVALNSEREALRIRRAGGDHRENDAGVIELIGLDLRNLQELHADAVARGAAAQRAVEAANGVREDARSSAQSAEAAATTGALAAHARELVGLLAETLRRASAAAGTLSPGARLRHAAELASIGKQIEVAMVQVVEAARSACSGVPSSDRPRWQLGEPFVAEFRKLQFGDGRIT